VTMRVWVTALFLGLVLLASAHALSNKQQAQLRVEFDTGLSATVADDDADNADNGGDDDDDNGGVIAAVKPAVDQAALAAQRTVEESLQMCRDSGKNTLIQACNFLEGGLRLGKRVARLVTFDAPKDNEGATLSGTVSLDEWFGQDMEDFGFKMVLNDKGYGVTITTSLSAPFATFINALMPGGLGLPGPVGSIVAKVGAAGTVNFRGIGLQIDLKANIANSTFGVHIFGDVNVFGITMVLMPCLPKPKANLSWCLAGGRQKPPLTRFLQ